MKKYRTLYLVHAVMACAVLYWVLDLSQSGRTAIDWTVIGLVVAAICFNLIQLGRRLYRFGGGKSLWHLLRTVLFWVIGLFNTALIRPEDVGGWKNRIGWGLLLIALVDTIVLLHKERQSTASLAEES